jgi:hypothetical protein
VLMLHGRRRRGPCSGEERGLEERLWRERTSETAE